MTPEAAAPAVSSRMDLFIVYSGDEDDRRFAESIGSGIGHVVEPRYVTLGQLKEFVTWNMIPGMSLVILSRAIADDPGRFGALLQTVANQRVVPLPYVRHYCICRGITAEELKQQPQFAPLFDNLMIWDEERLPAVLQEIRGSAPYFRHAAVRSVLRSMLLGILLKFTDIYSMYAAMVLAAAWWFEWGSGWLMPLVVWCSFTAGMRLNYMQPTDFWPWLGRRWKRPRVLTLMTWEPRGPAAWMPVGLICALALLAAVFAAREAAWPLAAALVVAGLAGQTLLDDRCRNAFARGSGFADAAAAELLKLGPAAGQRGLCRQEDVELAGRGLIIDTYFAAIRTALGLLWRGGPAVLLVSAMDQNLVGWVMVPALIGLVVPSLAAPGLQRMLTVMGESAGLTAGLAGKLRQPTQPPFTTFTAPPLDQADVAAFPPTELRQIQRWLELMRQQSPGRYLVRPWRALPDYVFISYAWRDDPELDVSSRAAAACAAAGIEHFLDKVNVSRDELFRKPLATGLARCTHFFLVLSANLLSGTVIKREIEMALQRWYMTLLPAVICIVEDELAEKLRVDPAVPLELRYLLTFCPQMTPAEASQPALVRYVVEWTRRQGKLRDWLPLLTPATILPRALRLPGIVEPQPEEGPATSAPAASEVEGDGTLG